ncbi:MAG: hypothetical protein AB7S70_04360 [Hyphomicrobium sp.]|uniref:hypothetical protein n=1 Tax=Hyphomicrobium sp. TaxID=82 RepID=UPI003D0E1C47
MAALLLSLRSVNINEGRRPDRIADFWQRGTLADIAGIGLDDLTAILVQFEGSLFCPRCPAQHSVRLANLHGPDHRRAGNARENE